MPLPVKEETRREIHDGLNVVESWNSTNGFIFYGYAGKLAINRQEDQEMHPLQPSLVYINTLMIQGMLANPEWLARMPPGTSRCRVLS